MQDLPPRPVYQDELYEMVHGNAGCLAHRIWVVLDHYEIGARGGVAAAGEKLTEGRSAGKSIFLRCLSLCSLRYSVIILIGVNRPKFEGELK